MLERFHAQGTEAGLDLDIQLEPGKRVYCFFGRNGAGKTVLLETLGRALLLAHTMFAEQPQGDVARPNVPESETPAARPPAAVSTQPFFRAAVHRELADLTFRVPREVRLDDVNVKTAAEGWGVTDLKAWVVSSSWMRLKRKVDRPVVAIGARDRGFMENLPPDRVRLLGDRDARFIQAFLRTYQAVTRQRVDTESLAEWLAARLIVNPAFAGGDDRSFEVDTILRLMEALDPTEFRGLASKSPEGFLRAIRYVDGALWLGSVPLDKLPSGYVSIIKLFQEILGGYAGWTAYEGRKDLADIEGFVLIDEIEAHLHPVWQAKMLPLLKRFFPRTTFFICTHSPLIVASTEEGEAYELERTDRHVSARRLGNPRAWYLADVYEQAFHVDVPLSDDSLDVPDLLLDFSVKVKDWLRTKDPARKAEALLLYERVVPSVPPTDPRRGSLDGLKDMLR